jgi:hypothetical protein
LNKSLPFFIIIFLFSVSVNAFSQLNWSTFIGGNDIEKAYGIKVDAGGNSFITGQTFSINFPIVSGAYQDSIKGSGDAFVTKLNSTGRELLFSTFIGSKESDVGNDITIDKFGNSYITGNSGKSFVAKLNPNGTTLIYFKSIGDGNSYKIALDSFGSTYITGSSNSSGYPVTTGAYDTVHNGGGDDAVITKLKPNWSSLAYSTFFGGDGGDQGLAITINSKGSSIITGFTYSNNFPTTAGAFQKVHQGNDSFNDIFLARFDSSGTNLLYSTLIGGNVYDYAYSIAVDRQEYTYLTGLTGSSNFPVTPGAYDKTINGDADDVFISKFYPYPSLLVYSTFIGGTSADVAYSLVLDNDNNAYITGLAWSKNFPVTIDAVDDINHSQFFTCFVSKLKADGSKLLYSTYLGGDSIECGEGISIDKLNNIYITGRAYSDNFPVTSRAFDTSFNGKIDAFVTNLEFCIGVPNIQALDTLIFPEFVCESQYYDTTIIIYNKGDCNLKLTCINFIGLDSSDFMVMEPNHFPIYIGSKDSVKFKIRFMPKTTSGTKIANLNIFINSPENQHTINLIAHNEFPVIQSVNQLSFPQIECPSSIQDTFIIYNKGICNLAVTGIFISGLDSFDFSILEPNNFPINVQSDDSINIVVSFNSDGIIGEKKAFLNINNNSSINPFIINLTAKVDSVAYSIDNLESDTIIIDLGTICTEGKDTTITIINKTSVGTTFYIENKDPQLEIVPAGKAGKKEGETPLSVPKKKHHKKK